MRKTAALLASLAFLAINSPLPAQTTATAAEAINAQALKGLFPGKFEAVWKGKQKLMIGAEANGTLKGYSEGKFDSGRWEISGNKLCVSFIVWTGGNRKCSEVYRNGGWYMGLLKKSGEANLRFRKK